ncbi:MAG: hypothetical protein Q9166_007188 [cf. Caloplaca sp. 2 TL-2023]
MLSGGSCYSASQERKLLYRINQKSPFKISRIRGRWLYYLHSSPKCILENVKQLLPRVNWSSSGSSGSRHVEIYITPRYISPWSSQATNIAHVCGLQDEIHRLEQGRMITIDYEALKDGQRDLDLLPIRDILHDRMTENLGLELPNMGKMFAEGVRSPLEVVNTSADKSGPLAALQEHNRKMRLGLDQANLEFLAAEFHQNLNRSPCRHHVFNAAWIIDGVRMDNTLFGMIKHTHQKSPDFTISAYSDNAAVLTGPLAEYWAPSTSRVWGFSREVVQPLIKVETHNHPTAISPFAGAATGSGGEIRDEGAVGRGSSPKAGLVGFWVSDLLIPGSKESRPWENDIGKPPHYASSLEIMLEAPIGSARFNNEFGRPALAGVFRTLLTNRAGTNQAAKWRGYHKPIMIAGGIGTVRPQHALKNPDIVLDGAHVIVLGGPAMLIGLGGGAASSSAGSEATAELDFNSVQRGNPEMERRAQMVISTCVSLGDESPIAFIHDVGAGGLSNAIPELVKDAGFGGEIELRRVESADKIVAKAHNGTARLILTDEEPTVDPPVPPIDLPMDLLFPPGRQRERKVDKIEKTLHALDLHQSLFEKYGTLDLGDLICRATQLIFHLPSVGSKMFLITIGDRSVGGLTVQDQLVGPWQTPVADAAVTLTSFNLNEQSRGGEAMAMGEKPTLALISPAASARMAVVESLMNLGTADIMGDGDLKRVKLSANWMAAVNHPGEGADLYDAVNAIGMELCPELGLAIPVGKDSTSMSVSWKDRETSELTGVTAPVSVVISAFSLIENVRNTWTPQLRRVEDVADSVLLFVDVAQGHKEMGGSALAQCLGQLGDEAPDVRDTQLIKHYFKALQSLHRQDIVLAYHDRSDGGLLATVAEMMFAGRCGADITIDGLAESESHVLEALFNEELGAVFQVQKGDESNFSNVFATCGFPKAFIQRIGHVRPTSEQSLLIRYRGETLVDLDRGKMQQWWSSTSFEMQKLRDDTACAESEYAALLDTHDPGLSYNLTFDPADFNHSSMATPKGPFTNARPPVAILREQGVNGHAEMAFAFYGIGDVLGAGNGWAKSILMHAGARKIFEAFFKRPDTFTLGVCNGCQMLTRLKELIPGAENWPTFVENTSQQFEARCSMVAIQHTPDRSGSSVFFNGMNGSSLPIVVSHGEGRAYFEDPTQLPRLDDENLIPLRYLDNYGSVTESYPANPNGSPGGIAGVRSRDGR